MLYVPFKEEDAIGRKDWANKVCPEDFYKGLNEISSLMSNNERFLEKSGLRLVHLKKSPPEGGGYRAYYYLTEKKVFTPEDKQILNFLGRDTITIVDLAKQLRPSENTMDACYKTIEDLKALNKKLREDGLTIPVSGITLIGVTTLGRAKEVIKDFEAKQRRKAQEAADGQPEDPETEKQWASGEVLEQVIKRRENLKDPNALRIIPEPVDGSIGLYDVSLQKGKFCKPSIRLNTAELTMLLRLTRDKQPPTLEGLGRDMEGSQLEVFDEFGGFEDTFMSLDERLHGWGWALETESDDKDHGGNPEIQIKIVPNLPTHNLHLTPQNPIFYDEASDSATGPRQRKRGPSHGKLNLA